MVSGTACHIREVKLSRKPVELIAASQKATVPMVVRTDGGVIAESLEIMHWALAQNDPEGWLERADHELIEANDGPFKAHASGVLLADEGGPSCDRLAQRAGQGVLAQMHFVVRGIIHPRSPFRPPIMGAPLRGSM